MADDNIVTSKTAAKKTVGKKTEAATTSVVQAQETAAATSTPAVKSNATIAKRSSTAKKTAETGTAAAPKKTRTVDQPVDDGAVSLRGIANVSDETRHKMIADAAYYKAEKRNFAPDHEKEDWVDAVREIDDLIARAKNITGS